MKTLLKIAIELLLVILFLSLPFETVIDQGHECDIGPLILQITNKWFLEDIFGSDSIKIQRCWSDYKKGKEKIIFIDKGTQKLLAINIKDTFSLFIKTSISSGRGKSWTPIGEFKILKKRISRTSKKYGGTMTYWNCITDNEKYAIHGLKDLSYESNLGRAVSHGCIRVSTLVAKEIYDTVPIGTAVLID